MIAGQDIFNRPCLTLFGHEVIMVENCPEDTIIFAEVGPRSLLLPGYLVQTFKPIAVIKGVGK